VWAADLWIDPTEAAENFAGQNVTAIKAEAHALPFARGFSAGRRWPGTPPTGGGSSGRSPSSSR
jgi:hypothetical protein